MSEAGIVSDLFESAWLRETFRLTRLKQQQAIAWLPQLGGTSTSKTADLVGVNKDDKVFAFEVKAPGNDIGSAFDQVCGYCKGANFVYCILFEGSVSETSLGKFRKTGMGLITYSLRDNSVRIWSYNNRLDLLKLVLDFEEQKGEHRQMTLKWFEIY